MIGSAAMSTVQSSARELKQLQEAEKNRMHGLKSREGECFVQLKYVCYFR
jgi:hypothetical protein